MTKTSKHLLFCVLMISSIYAIAQDDDEVFTKASGGMGLPFGFLNAKNSFASGISLSVERNLLIYKSSSFSLGTNLKLGYVNPYGLGILADLFQISTSDPKLDYADLPLMLHYNFMKNTTGAIKRYGFFIGGGIDYLFTGYIDSTGNSRSVLSWSTIIDAGFRVNLLELDFSKVFELQKNVGGINSPVFYEITLSFKFY